MAAITRSRLMRWIAPIGALLAWAAVTSSLLLMDLFAFEELAVSTGLSTLVAAAEPPLGRLAVIAIAVGAGAVAGLVVWSALFLLFGPGGLFNRLAVGDDGRPVVRHADAHPDAPPRRPLSAHADLGAIPVPDPGPPPAVRPIPADLDQPIAAFHPAAIPEVPREPVRPVAPLVPQPLAAGEWIETVDLTPSMPDAAAPNDGESVKPTIESLLQRLETARPRRLQTR
ncbi:MAG TPA: hypothetical protein VF638_11065 [Sphingomonas sp.]